MIVVVSDGCRDCLSALVIAGLDMLVLEGVKGGC